MFLFNDNIIYYIILKLIKIFLIKKDSTIKSFILQEATPVESAKDKISGRVTFEKEDMMRVRITKNY